MVAVPKDVINDYLCGYQGRVLSTSLRSNLSPGNGAPYVYPAFAGPPDEALMLLI